MSVENPEASLHLEASAEGVRTWITEKESNPELLRDILALVATHDAKDVAMALLLSMMTPKIQERYPSIWQDLFEYVAHKREHR